RLLSVLRTGGVEVARARAAFDAGGQRYAAGSHVVLMAQPASAFAKSLLERQDYPDLRVYPGGPPQRPYDVTAHTLPLLMGVDVRSVDAPFVATLDPVAEPRVSGGGVFGRGRFLALGHGLGDLVALAACSPRASPCDGPSSRPARPDARFRRGRCSSPNP